VPDLKQNTLQRNLKGIFVLKKFELLIGLDSIRVRYFVLHLAMPNLYIIAGCNGAGQTTASYSIPPDILNCRKFLNADNIASGLSDQAEFLGGIK
jgi:hypothetical protein